MSLYRYPTSVELYHTDATGALFYGSLFMLIHQAFAAFLKDQGHDLKELIDKSSLLCPVVHTEGNFLSPLGVGDSVDVEIKKSSVGRTSFTLEYEVIHQTAVKAQAKVTHVCLGSDFKKVEVPEKVLKILHPILSN